MNSAVLWLREKLRFVDPLIRWLLITLKWEKGPPEDIVGEFRELWDEEYWKTIPKSELIEFVPEPDDDEGVLDVGNDEDRLRGCEVRGRIMPVGTRWTDKTTCIYYECKEYNMLSEVHCPEWCPECHFRRCKEIPGDPNANYPDCCPTVECEPPKFRNFAEFEAIADQCKHPRDCC